MKLYKTKNGVIIETAKGYFEAQLQDWDNFINDDNILKTITALLSSGFGTKKKSIADSAILAPVGKQELWACGVTYLRSKVGRQEESKLSGGADFYAKVYEAERPEVFFKATPNRIVGPGDKVNIRKDSTWDVPEPELTLVVTSSGKIIGYTIGNDMSSRSIEGENPLYLPQAKTYDACAAVGPCIYITEEPLDKNTMIRLEIIRNNTSAFSDKIAISQMKRTPQELVSYVFRECSFPDGCLIMTGTGIVPASDFTLQSGDEIKVSIDNIGTLINKVA
ncbi:2-hydroxyhepta-2,4-diene-1,7-dioate isomerase [Chitinophagaceae bacterium IBVUCB2]|nr:2-hydroxyhepta-2,4-diene-1,7-dioate isomerase [Chitinophagaceae bacterium IBVUCB2]